MKAQTASNSKDNHSKVTEHISRVVLSLKEDGRDIDTDYVANVVESRIDTHRVSPHLTKYLATLELKQQIRSFLRHMLEPGVVVADKIAAGLTNQDDLFGGILQTHYPADRVVMGEMKSVYVTRESMTGPEVEIVCQKMERAGNALIEHAKAFRAWFLEK